ncbi:hypothetical protein K7H22_13935 [Seohaeicola saemankumensis]|uniref:hypothetical protein n=1 Tax=Seohaeicola saemankumensis TaxID=481181 RepID=UPI001E31D41A|nr:hypothetical protein [Seohaeicola saemankumensis]MCD1627097.1 hypothetical protein [Seohaeicola saemankumensis]
MTQDEVSEKSQAICTLFADKLSLSRGSLEQRLRRAGRRLPARIREQARVITEAEMLAANPKLARRVDPDKLERAFAEVRRHLLQIDPADRRRGAVLGVLGGLAFNLLLFAALAFAGLRWQGLI